MNGTPGLLPTGTVTFFFTDIEGSTQRWDRDRTAMQAAVARHDEMMQKIISGGGGYVFKTVGDAFCASFSRPEEAIAAALDAQRALAAADFAAVDGIAVRMAIHTGTADERGGDYFGPAVNRVARLLAIGHGRQVLVSGVSSDLARDSLPPEASLRDLGEHRLKDLALPEHVYQLHAPGLMAEFPSLRSLNSLPNNLPRSLTSFVGRETEIAEITALLDRHQLVTLVGSGGIGKTRTSLQIGANLLDASGGGVWFIELAPLTTGDYIASTVALALGIEIATDGDPIDGLARALKAKDALLIFDNCEHLVEPAARVIAAILRAAPKVKILASSRQGLGIAGEMNYRMPSLGIDGDAAILLFADRARAVDRNFTITDENAAIVADICTRLDGIPLAIELAASRVKMITPKQLRERLDERFRVLTGGSRDALPRQQTLRALIDWSHDLLDERERTLFRRLGIFVNGFTLEGAVAVGSGPDLDDLDTFDVLASLVDKSLVLAEPAGDALRYRLLESSRVYAREKQAAAAEQERCAELRLRYLRDSFASARDRFQRTARASEIAIPFAVEIEDIRSALDWGLKNNVALGAGLLAEVRHFWNAIGQDGEGIARIEAYIGVLPDDDHTLLARLWVALGFLLAESLEAVREGVAVQNAVAHARLGDRPDVLGEALTVYAACMLKSRRFEDAAAALTEAEGTAPLSPVLRLAILGSQATSASMSGDQTTAIGLYDRVRKEYRTLGNLRGELVHTLNLAEAEHANGQPERAIATSRSIVPAIEASGDRRLLANALANEAGYWLVAGDLDSATRVSRQSIREFAIREPDAPSIAPPLEHLALALAIGGDIVRAATIEGYADATFRDRGIEREFTEATTYERLSALLREKLAPAELDRLLAAGANLVPEDAILLALDEASTSTTPGTL